MTQQLTCRDCRFWVEGGYEDGPDSWGFCWQFEEGALPGGWCGAFAAKRAPDHCEATRAMVAGESG